MTRIDLPTRRQEGEKRVGDIEVMSKSEFSYLNPRHDRKTCPHRAWHLRQPKLIESSVCVKINCTNSMAQWHMPKAGNGIDTARSLTKSPTRRAGAMSSSDSPMPLPLSSLISRSAISPRPSRFLTVTHRIPAHHFEGSAMFVRLTPSSMGAAEVRMVGLKKK